MEQAELARSARRSFTRLTRFINQLMREQYTGCPVTLQQCYTLEALVDGPLSMKTLAAEVALHQSTLTRIVEKLEKQALVRRSRNPANQRSVEVEITPAGRKTHRYQDGLCLQMIADLLQLIPADRRTAVVAAMETLSELLDPQNEAFQQLLENCCADSCGKEGT